MQHYRRRELSPVEVIDAHLQRIAALNPALSAYLTVTAEQARQEAKAAEADFVGAACAAPCMGFLMRQGHHRDGEHTHDARFSFFRDHIPPLTPIASCACATPAQFYWASASPTSSQQQTTTVNPHFGTAHNPWNIERITEDRAVGRQRASRQGSAALRSVQIPAGRYAIRLRFAASWASNRHMGAPASRAYVRT
jgi:hypothetical protein